METRLVRSKSQLEIVLNQMQESEKEKNYIKAQSHKNQAEKIAKQIAQLQSKCLKNRHKQDLHSIEAMHVQQMNLLKTKWLHQLKQTKEEGQQIKKQMLQKHENEHNSYHTKFLEELQIQQYHQSGAALALMKKQQALAKIQQFMDAHQVQIQRMKLQQQQKQMLKNIKHQKHKIEQRKLTKKHEHEMKVLCQKIELKIQQTQKQQQKQKDALLQKHKNTILDFTAEQKKENLVSSGRIKNRDEKTMGSSSKMQRLKSTKKITSPLKDNINAITQ